MDTSTTTLRVGRSPEVRVGGHCRKEVETKSTQAGTRACPRFLPLWCLNYGSRLSSPAATELGERTTGVKGASPG